MGRLRMTVAMFAAVTANLMAGGAQVVTPEPSTYLIVGGALVAGAWLHRRRNKK